MDERGLKLELRGFLDTLQISCGGLKMHQAWMVYSSNLDYVGRYPHMTMMWQTVLVIPASTASCERGFSTQNHIKSTLRRPTRANVLLSFLNLRRSSQIFVQQTHGGSYSIMHLVLRWNLQKRFQG